jgi:hypothetical protein
MCVSTLLYNGENATRDLLLQQLQCKHMYTILLATPLLCDVHATETPTALLCYHSRKKPIRLRTTAGASITSALFAAAAAAAAAFSYQDYCYYYCYCYLDCYCYWQYW